MNHYLAKSSRVSNYTDWYCFMHKHRNLKIILLYFLIEEREHTVNLLADVVRNRFDLHFACLDFG